LQSPASRKIFLKRNLNFVSPCSNLEVEKASLKKFKGFSTCSKLQVEKS